MSEDQKDQTISEIARGVKTIKNWWPVVAVIATLLGIAINGTSTYDNKVAKKDDLKEITSQLVDLNNKMTELYVKFNDYKQDATLDRSRIRLKVDSLALVIKEIQQRSYSRLSRRDIKQPNPNGKGCVVERFVNGKRVWEPIDCNSNETY